MSYTVLNRDELPRDRHTFEFEGSHYDDTEVSFIWVDMPPEGMVQLHRHPYKEVFIIQEGAATFTLTATDVNISCGAPMNQLPPISR